LFFSWFLYCLALSEFKISDIIIAAYHLAGLTRQIHTGVYYSACCAFVCPGPAVSRGSIQWLQMFGLQKAHRQLPFLFFLDPGISSQG
jgi:hypothetical protein